MFQDKTLICRDCGAEFVFTASEQAFFAEKGFNNAPSRCPACRRMRKQQNNERGGISSQPRELFDAICAECGVKTQVPFRPSGNRPVYCRDCYNRLHNRQ
ncbi:MAG: zinc-ribbon domain containing protein [Sporomusaceae bacterium]|nr:zinc-ribbon domain containing protein [Sporomusaceae bacterium]